MERLVSALVAQDYDAVTQYLGNPLSASEADHLREYLVGDPPSGAEVVVGLSEPLSEDGSLFALQDLTLDGEEPTATGWMDTQFLVAPPGRAPRIALDLDACLFGHCLDRGGIDAEGRRRPAR